jgi:hypothetical protein
MINLLDNQLGYYSVGDKSVFLNKYEALVAGTNSNQEVKYHWYDSAFSTFDRTKLGKVSLNEMYKNRAQQIRDSYDYVILNYSGGCDSWNILKTFLDNKIKLDQIMVSWPFTAAESKKYKANKNDTTAFNFMSEWDFTTKPDLDWLVKTHPEIKIELIDWADPFIKDSSFVSQDKFNQLNHFHNLADLARSTLFSETERKLIEQGKTVATIWGIDKPYVFFDKTTKKIGMGFPDSVTTVGHPPVYNPNGTEFFYWSPRMPELAFEMAYQTVLWFKSRPSHQSFLFPSDKKFVHPYINYVQINQIAGRDACYTTWAEKENTFQVNKPTSISRQDKDFWLYTSPELTHHVLEWKGIFKDHASVLDNRFIAFNKNQEREGYVTCITDLHHVCDF